MKKILGANKKSFQQSEVRGGGEKTELSLGEERRLTQAASGKCLALAVG